MEVSVEVPPFLDMLSRLGTCGKVYTAITLILSGMFHSTQVKEGFKAITLKLNHRSQRGRRIYGSILQGRCISLASGINELEKVKAAESADQAYIDSVFSDEDVVVRMCKIPYRAPKFIPLVLESSTSAVTADATARAMKSGLSRPLASTTLVGHDTRSKKVPAGTDKSDSLRIDAVLGTDVEMGHTTIESAGSFPECRISNRRRRLSRSSRNGVSSSISTAG